MSEPKSESPPYSEGVQEVIDEMRSNFEQGIKDLIEEVNAPVWEEDEYTIGIGRDKDKIPQFQLALFKDGGEISHFFTTSFDDALDDMDDLYCLYDCDNGWGNAVIDDLEILKAKIQERIDRMKQTIKDEEGEP